MFGNPVVLIAFLAGIAVLSWLAWISIQSLFQARLLREAREGGASGLEPGRRVALHGEVRLSAVLRRSGLGELLWCRTRTQELRGWGRHRRWRTVGDETEVAIFGIDVQGREIRMDGFPTEVQSTSTRTDYSSPGFFGLFHSNGDERVTTEFLPVAPRVTLVGRLDRRGEGWVVVKDSKVGLLLTTKEPGEAALWETVKGVAGLLGVTAAVVAGLALYLQGR